METNQTSLQKIVARAADYLAKHIESAIDSGAKITPFGDGVIIEDVYIGKSVYDSQADAAVLVCLKSETIVKALRPAKKELTERAEKLRAELNEIEKQLQK